MQVYIRNVEDWIGVMSIVLIFIMFFATANGWGLKNYVSVDDIKKQIAQDRMEAWINPEMEKKSDIMCPWILIADIK